MPQQSGEPGVCLLDSTGQVLDMDLGFKALTGAAPLPGRRLVDLVPWTPEPKAGASVQVQHQGRTGILEMTLRAVSPRLAPVAFTVKVRRVDSGHDTRIVRQLRIAQRTLDALVEASPVTILTLDPQMRVTMWNRAAERMFGWKAEEILGRPYPLVPAAEWGAFAKLYERVLGGHGFTGVESWRQRRDGSPIHLRMHTAPMRDAEGEVSGAMAILEDLTEKHLLEEQIRHAQKMEAVGRLAGGIAHDFNNLLTVVMGMCDLMELEDELPPQPLERVGEIRRVSESACELVAQLMTFSRRQVMRVKVFDLNDRLRDSARMLGRLISESIELRLELSETGQWIKTDPTQLDQILVNLVVNASDSMPEGGSIVLRTMAVGAVPSRRDDGERSSGRHVCLEVQDGGHGIPADVLPHIFDPFFTTKKSGAGTGLGLANVYGIVQQSGGTVEVDSRAGEGTCFRVYLPLEQAQVQRRQSTREGPLPRHGGTEQILLVEDNAAVRRSTAKLLESMGYGVETACDGAEALERMWDGLDVDLVLTDLSMPRLGGGELAKELHKRSPGLPIVLMSGNLDITELKDEVEAGRMAFLQKPVTLRELSKAVRATLDRAHPPDSKLTG